MHKLVRITTVPLSLSLFCEGFLRELSAEYEVVAVSSPGAELDRVARREGVRTVGVPMERRIAPLKDLCALLRLVRLFRRERPQLVHSMTPKAGLLGMMAAWCAGVPVRIHTFTGLVFPTSRGIKRLLLMASDWMTCRCATHVIPEGEGVKEDLRHYGITSKPLRPLGYGNVRGIDLNRYARTPETCWRGICLRESLGIGEEAVVFLFVGRLVRDKGIHELVEAFERLRHSCPDVYLLLVGSEEPHTDPLDADVRQRIRHASHIHCTGWQEDVCPWYAAADVLAFPSYREGFPNVVIEAGAMGLPSIVTDINGSREIVREGWNGCIIPPHSTEALFRAMDWMSAHPMERKAMGANARPWVASRYEQGFVRQCLRQFYKEVLP